MKSDFKRGPLIKAVLVFVGIFIIVLVIRYMLVKDIDFGFSVVIAVLVVFIYYIIKRLLPYVRKKET